MTGRYLRSLVAALTAVCIAFPAVACSSCGGSGKPTFMSFTGKGSESAQNMDKIVKKLKKKYKGKVVFVDINMDDPANKGKMEKYHVTMNPTFIVLNAEGQVKETFMGAAHEDMLVRAIESYIPREETPTGTSSYPSSPGTPIPSAPGPLQTAPINRAP